MGMAKSVQFAKPAEFFSMVLKIYVELAGYGGYNGRIETKRRDGL